MDENQIKLLIALAKKLNTVKKDKAEVMKSLQSAKILTKSGNFTKHYNHLNSNG